jgi:hypothetical protein
MNSLAFADIHSRSESHDKDMWHSPRAYLLLDFVQENCGLSCVLSISSSHFLCPCPGTNLGLVTFWPVWLYCMF